MKKISLLVLFVAIGVFVGSGILAQETNHALNGTPTFQKIFISSGGCAGQWYDTMGNVNDDNSDTFVGGWSCNFNGNPYLEYIATVNFDGAKVVDRIEYIHYGYTRPPQKLYDNVIQAALYYNGSWHSVDSRQATMNKSTISINLGTPQSDVTAIRIWFRLGNWKASANQWLVESKLYEIRAFGSPVVILPTIETNPATNIAETSATLNGNVTDDGGDTVTDRGFEWGTAPGSYSDSTSSGSGTGSFSLNVGSFSSNTTYYFRAYATNSVGTAYGSESSFTTASPPPPPPPASSCQSHNISGYAWSDNIGWISANCGNEAHWALVDDAVSDGTETMVWSDTFEVSEIDAERDFYEIEDLPPGVESIASVKMWLKIQGKFKGYLSLYGTEYSQPFSLVVSSGSTWGGGTDPNYYYLWGEGEIYKFSATPAEINDLQIGVGLLSWIQPGFQIVDGRMSQVYLEVIDGDGNTYILRPNGTGKATGIDGPSAIGSLVDYGIDFDEDEGAGNGIMSGYAWSDNIGWISFNTADLSGCPVGTCEARVDLPTGNISGWARALAPVGQPLSVTGGWDGWISLSGTTPNYQVNIDYALDPSEFEGWAWGSDVVGWISFNCSNTGTCGTSNYKLTTNYSYPYNSPPTVSLLPVQDVATCGSSTPQHIFEWVFSDVNAGDTQSAYQVQIDNNSNFNSPTIDSGKITSGSNSYAPLASELALLSFNNTYHWRVKVWDDNSSPMESDWDIPASKSFFQASGQYPNASFDWVQDDPSTLEIDFTETVTNCPACSYSWDFGDGGTSPNPDPNYIYTIGGTYTVNLDATTVGRTCSYQDVLSLTSDLPLPVWRETTPF